MQKIILIFSMVVLCAIASKAQDNTDSIAAASRKHQTDSLLTKTLADAGATTVQIQQFKNTIALYSLQIKTIRENATLTMPQKVLQIKAIVVEKDAQYKAILGDEKLLKYRKILNAPPGVDPFL